MRLLLTPPADGAWNMALDEALLEGHRLGLSPPTLRLYGWVRPTLSVGRAQKLDGLGLDACVSAGVDVVRRPTGGRAVLHAGDCTYAVVRGGLPAGVTASYAVLAAALSEALASLGVPHAAPPRPAGRGADHPGCFDVATPADLVADAAKLIGSAQLRRAGSVLQHGSIFLQFPHELLAWIWPAAAGGGATDLRALSPTPLSVEQVGRAIAQAFEVPWSPAEPTAWELARAAEGQTNYSILQST